MQEKQLYYIAQELTDLQARVTALEIMVQNHLSTMLHINKDDLSKEVQGNYLDVLSKLQNGLQVLHEECLGLPKSI
jgi:hypothetical protein